VGEDEFWRGVYVDNAGRHGRGRASAFFLGVTEVAARARVHGRNQHE
ncbi:uncharacterized protein METZ01_LOCUS484114, partial [marine metagenome]